MTTNRRTSRGRHRCSASSLASRQYQRTCQRSGNRDSSVLPRGSQSRRYLLEFFIRNLDPILYKLFPLLHRRKRRLGELPFNLGNVYLLAGRIHEEIDGIEHSQLERKLLMFLDVIMSICLCALTDLFGRPISAVGQKRLLSLLAEQFCQATSKISPHCRTGILQSPRQSKCRLR